MDHFPVKLLPRASQDWKTWGCEGCTEIFATKNEVNKHLIAELRKSLSSDDWKEMSDKTSQGENEITNRIARLRKEWYISTPHKIDVLALCDDYETLSSKRERFIKLTRELVDAASLWSRVDDHTYCHDDEVDRCAVVRLRDALESVEDLLLEE